jgi:rRNA maturation endonuclease Nob1
MSDIIESIKQGASQVLSEIDQRGQIKAAIDGIRHQLSAVERRRRISALENQVKTLQSEVKQLTEALGLQTLSLFDAGRIAHPELSRLCERINELRADLGSRRAELTELKVQAARSTQCPQCQANVPAGDGFCPKCGAQLKAGAAASSPASATKPRTVVRLRCPKCKTILPPEAGFCPTCGVKIVRPRTLAGTAPAPKRFCPSCGAEMSPSARFCSICGQSAPDAS